MPISAKRPFLPLPALAVFVSSARFADACVGVTLFSTCRSHVVSPRSPGSRLRKTYVTHTVPVYNTFLKPTRPLIESKNKCEVDTGLTIWAGRRRTPKNRTGHSKIGQGTAPRSYNLAGTLMQLNVRKYSTHVNLVR